MFGNRENVLRFAALNTFAEVHDVHSSVLRHTARRGKIVRDINDGNAQLAVEPLEEIEHRKTQRYVDHGDGFVRDDELRVHGERPRKEYSLPLPARELMGIFFEKLVGRREFYEVEQVVDLLFQVASEPEPLADGIIERLIDGAHRVERRIGILLHELYGGTVLFIVPRHAGIYVDAVERQFSRSGFQQSRDDLAERRFAAAAFAHDRNDLPFLHGEVDVFEGVHLLRGAEHGCLFVVIYVNIIEFQQHSLPPQTYGSKRNVPR